MSCVVSYYLFLGQTGKKSLLALSKNSPMILNSTRNLPVPSLPPSLLLLLLTLDIRPQQLIRLSRVNQLNALLALLPSLPSSLFPPSLPPSLLLTLDISPQELIRLSHINQLDVLLCFLSSL